MHVLFSGPIPSSWSCLKMPIIHTHTHTHRIAIVYTVISDSFATLWTIAHQAPLSLVFPRQENWTGLPFPSPGDVSNPGIKPVSPALQVDSLPLSHHNREYIMTLCYIMSLSIYIVIYNDIMLYNIIYNVYDTCIYTCTHIYIYVCVFIYTPTPPKVKNLCQVNLKQSFLPSFFYMRKNEIWFIILIKALSC